MDTAAFRDLLCARGLPSYLVEAQIGIRQACAAGEYSQVTDHAARLAGRPLASFSDYLRCMA
jgi:hypothetical protein